MHTHTHTHTHTHMHADTFPDIHTPIPDCLCVRECEKERELLKKYITKQSA